MRGIEEGEGAGCGVMGSAARELAVLLMDVGNNLQADRGVSYKKPERPWKLSRSVEGVLGWHEIRR